MECSKVAETVSSRALWDVLSKCDLLIHASCLLPFRQDFSSYKVYGTVLYLAIPFLLVNRHQAAFKASRQMECP